MTPDDTRAHNDRLAAAWEAGHTLAEKLHGDEGLSFFTPPKGNDLMAKMEALPVGSVAADFDRLVREHLGAPADGDAA